MHLDRRWAEGTTNAWTLWEEIRTRGCHGTVSAYPRPLRTGAQPAAAQPPSPRAVTRWILTRPDRLCEDDQRQLAEALGHCPELEALTGHVRSFARMLTQAGEAPVTQWTAAVRADDLPGLHGFAAGLEPDLPAVTRRAHRTLELRSRRGRREPHRSVECSFVAVHRTPVTWSTRNST